MLPPLENRYTDLPDALWRRQAPTPLRNPRLLDVNHTLASALGLTLDDEDALRDILGGQRNWPGSQPLAMKYGGHQFGGWNPDLGDGRGLLIGELQLADGTLRDLHLKGSGPTPFSRRGDGRAVLRSSIREYLAGEALQALGVPTSRVLALAGSEEPVRRERLETGATVLRVARTHIRFGHFEWLCHSGRDTLLQPLADHVIAREYPDCQGHGRYVDFFRAVVQRTARLMADWQCCGFAHGVMNTDNFSIAGETLDFGPYGFMEAYDPRLICNHSDHNGRYAWYLQPSVGLWNLNALAQALVPLIPVPALQEALACYEPTLIAHHEAGVIARLGLDGSEPEDRLLIQDWQSLLQRSGADFHRSFRALGRPVEALEAAVAAEWGDHAEAATAWLSRYARRVDAGGTTETDRIARILARNPHYVLRNYLAELAIRGAEQGDLTPLQQLLEAVRSPFVPQDHLASLDEPPPAWGQCLSISCSS